MKKKLSILLACLVLLPAALCPAGASASTRRASSGVRRGGAGGSAAVEKSGAGRLTRGAVSGKLESVI